MRDSDGTVIFSLAPLLTGGAATAAECARRLNKPWLHLTPATPEPAQRLRKFVATHGMQALNIAGPRASEEPHVAAFVRQVLEETFPAGAADGDALRAHAS